MDEWMTATSYNVEKYISVQNFKIERYEKLGKSISI